MCVILYKPEYKKIDYELLKECFRTNPDGAGYMYNKDGKVIIRKGFMTFGSLVKSLKTTIREDLGGSSIGTKMVIHCRISTQGGVNKELTHPYPVCGSYKDMKLLNCRCSVGMAHNGILRKYSSGAKDHNDSMEFIKELAYPTLKFEGLWLDDTVGFEIINHLSEGNRLIFLDGNGKVVKVGSWVNVDGFELSHPVRAWKTSAFKKL